MADDFYKTLGLGRDASQADIQKAYRELARKYHPDLNPDKDAKVKFQEVQRAFDVLNDTGKRELYDRYGSSFENVQAAQARGGQPWGQPGTAAGDDFDFSQFFGERYGGSPEGGFGDIFSQFRRASAGRGAKQAARRGGDIRSEIEIPFGTSILGGEVHVSVDRGGGHVETISVKIPAGIEDGKEMRLRGQGQQVEPGGQAGDILLKVKVARHPWFERRQNNLHVKVPVTLGEAAGGGKIDVPTPYGTVAVTVPPGSSTGTKLRIRGQGVKPKKGAPGDLFVELQVMLPKDLSETEREVLRQIDREHPSDPRRELQW
jgi:curved DNA-binding protein